MSRSPAAPARSGSVIALATAAELPFDVPVGQDGQQASRLAAYRAVKSLVSAGGRIVIDHHPGLAPTVFVANAPQMSLSISHCGDRAAAFAAIGSAWIGIDLEREDAASVEHARYFLTTREEASLRLHTVVALWALKEAAWKALSLRNDVAFHALELQLDTAGELRGISVCGRPSSASATLSEPWPGYVLATVRIEDVQ